MKIDRTKNASRNIIFGVALNIYQLILPFILRTAMIYSMGVKYVGLNSLFASVLQVLNLAELGVGSAMVFSMYKPIVEDDSVTICALLNQYKKYYRMIGGVIAGMGMFLLPFIPRLIKGEVPDEINIYIIYLLNLGATVLSYWMFAYKSSILSAHQRNDILSKILIITSSIQYALQLAILFWMKNYYIYLLVGILTQILSNILISSSVNHYFPYLKPQGEIDEKQSIEIRQRIKDLFTSRIGGVVYNSVDTIVISAFLGLNVLAVYQNYFYILTSISGLITVIFSACTAGIGNSLVVETKEKNYQDLRTFTFIICWIAGACSCCLLCLYQPFMELWVGKKLMLDFSAVICFTLYFFVRQINALLNMYKDASGMWHEDKYRPLAAAGTNLILNLVLVNCIGIYGVLLSTVFAIVCVGMPWLIHNLFTVIFEKKYIWSYLKNLFYYVVIVLLSCAVNGVVCWRINNSLLLTFIARGLISCILPNLLFFMFYRKLVEFKKSLELFDNISKGKMNFLLRKLGMDK